MKKFLTEFKDFALRGNVMNLAVGVIIGAAFQAIVTSLTNDILAPLLGLFTGKDLSGHSLNIFGVEIMYGAFVTSIINFVIMAFVVFIMVKLMNKVLAPKPAPPGPPPRLCPYCMTELNPKATRCPACTSQLPS